MKFRTNLFVGLLVALCFSHAHVVRGADDPKAPATQPAPAPKVKFRPPVTDAPAVRLTGGSRGSGENAVLLDVLAPAQAGETTQEQPSLFWYQSKPSPAKFELTLIQENKVKPLVHVKVDQASKAGIQRLKLSDHQAKLVPGIEYQWVVALINDPDNRSTDTIASGVIKRVAPSAELQQKLSKATPETKEEIYADAGIWYDALATLSDEVEAHPNDKTLRQTRADLLRQVGLNAAAQSEAPQSNKTEAK